MRKKCGSFFGTEMVMPSHSRNDATHHPVPLGGSANNSRDRSLEGNRREGSRRPELALGQQPSLSLRLEYYDQSRSAQPTSTDSSRLATFRYMIAPLSDSQSSLASALADAVNQYEASGNLGALMERLHRLRDGVTPDALVTAVEPWLHMPEVAGPLYERVVDEQPKNARALVILANAYWLSGRGPEVVGELATRALSADPENRGAWHLWALTESNQRDRTIRWLQITQRFPTDQLAKAALADNAASLAATEHDKEALALAIGAYEDLWALSPTEQQRAALESALTTLRNYQF